MPLFSISSRYIIRESVVLNILNIYKEMEKYSYKIIILDKLKKRLLKPIEENENSR